MTSAKKGLSFTALILLTGTLLGCGEAAQPQNLNFDTAAPGYQLYAQSCKGCHGEYLQGRNGPALDRVGARLSQEQILDRIANGAQGMPAFDKRLEPAQQQELAAFLAGLK